jgi:molybdopterin-binding protein
MKLSARNQLKGKVVEDEAVAVIKASDVMVAK